MKSDKQKLIRFILFVIFAACVLIYLFQNPTISEVSEDTLESIAIPQINASDIIVKHTGYTLCFSPEDKQPYWVAYVLTADEVNNNVAKRNDNFREDPDIPGGSAKLSDYKKSGYDRGHLIPAADLHWSEKSMDDSFFLSNMSPQVGAFNRGIWEHLEECVRQFALDNKSVCVVTGPVLSDGPYKTIGKSKVSVPNYFYKVILDYSEPDKKAIGFILPNEGSKQNLGVYAVSVDEIETLTGIDFFYILPDKEENKLESSFDLNKWNLIY